MTGSLAMLRTAALLLGSGLVLASCVPSSHELRAPVDRLVAERLGAPTPALSDAQLDAMLAQPIDSQAAVKIALARSPRLREAFDQLDVAGGDLAAALGLGPLSVDAKARLGLGADEYELDAIQSLLPLLLAPSRRAAAHAELAAARAAAAAA
ncbi:MAG TPA: hypothetical protein VFP84_12505, partial [Kofleriaceae bacterium]|nr:hypothetical protein [Kofleriaceae bacterium]